MHEPDPELPFCGWREGLSAGDRPPGPGALTDVPAVVAAPSFVEACFIALHAVLWPPEDQ